MPRLSKFLWLFCLSLAVPAKATAQLDAPSLIEEVDPGATGPKRSTRTRDPLLDAPVHAPAQRAPIATETPPAPSRAETQPDPVVPAATAAASTEPTPRGEDDGANKKPASKLKPIALPKATDADLQQLWTQWQTSLTAQDRARTETLQKGMLAVRDELGASDLDTYAAAALRLADQRRAARDAVGAIELSVFATDLAPNLPWAHLGLARAYFSSDPSDMGRYGRAFARGIGLLAKDPRTGRALLGDLGGALIAALLATAAAILAILFIRSGRYFLHDFHHLFPRAAARWQTVPLAVIVLSLPWIFRLGLVPSFLVLFAALTLYLSGKERIVAATALVLVALTPLFAQELSRHTAFFRTPAEDVFLLERGGPEAAGAVQRVQARDAQGRATWSELFAWGRYALRRGQLDAATELFKKAAILNGNDARLQVNLGNARFGAGDLEGAHAQYARAAELTPTLAAAHFNMARYHERKAATLTGTAAAQEVGSAQVAQGVAEELDRSILLREPLPEDAPASFNRLLMSPGLSWGELAPLAMSPDAPERLAGQLSWRLLGASGGLAPAGLMVLIAALIAGFGSLAGALRASRRCDSCGLSVCRRCDPDLPAASGLCAQCVNVFTRKGVVAPQVKVRKKLEVERFRTRQERSAWLLAVLCSGAGHLFSGRTLRGAGFAFVFLFGVSIAAFGNGVFRTPLGEVPLLFRLLPAVIVLGGVYLLSLRSLRKAQAR